MAKEKGLHEDLKALGEGQTRYAYDGADASLLERFPNPQANTELNPFAAELVVEITAPEFTSLCPKTGQPDFATIVVLYEPDEHCVESKSFKLYLGSFRNDGMFHEAVVARICNDLVGLLEPKWLRVQGQFTPRGGIKFWPTAEYTSSSKL